MGTSVRGRIVRAATSAHTRNTLPVSAESGSSFLWSTPNIPRTVCGMISPTNPITPDTCTTNPTISEAMTRYTRRYGCRSVPSVTAVSSPMSIRFSIRAWEIKKSVQGSTTHRIRKLPLHCAPARLPISQNCTVINRLGSSATYTIRFEKAEQSELSATPAKISFTEVMRPPMPAMAITENAAASAPMNAPSPTPAAPKSPAPSRSVSVAPSDAPEEIPSTYGSASGF